MDFVVLTERAIFVTSILGAEELDVGDLTLGMESLQQQIVVAEVRT